MEFTSTSKAETNVNLLSNAVPGNLLLLNPCSEPLTPGVEPMGQGRSDMIAIGQDQISANVL